MSGKLDYELRIVFISMMLNVQKDTMAVKCDKKLVRQHLRELGKTLVLRKSLYVYNLPVKWSFVK